MQSFGWTNEFPWNSTGFECTDYPIPSAVYLFANLILSPPVDRQILNITDKLLGIYDFKFLWIIHYLSLDYHR